MLPHHVALVSESDRVSFPELAAVAAALQKQVACDVVSTWQVRATVCAYPTLEEVPCGYWPILVMDGPVAAGTRGAHLDGHGQPFAIVSSAASWSLGASHVT